MKTKNPAAASLSQKLLLFLPLILLVMISLSSCSASKKAAKRTVEIAPPPPAVLQRPVPGQKEGDAYIVVDEMPEFPGGDEALLTYIARNTRYPLEAKNKNIQGRVITRFKVKEDGTVSDVSILKGINTYLDDEALRVVSTIPRFTPGKLKGVVVPVWYMIPITFTLKDGPPQRPSRFEVNGNDTIYSYTMEMPQFPGGIDALKRFKSEKTKYPKKIKNLGLEGVVFVRFLIGKNGTVSDVKIMQGVSPSLDAEAIRVTKLMPAWQPGKEKGRPVKFMYMTNYDFLITPRVPPVVEEGAPFVVVEEMPVFPGGDSALLAYIARNTKYPESAKVNKVEGRVIVRFCVTDVGGIDRVSVLKGVDPELDAESVRVIKTLPKFYPGKQGGKPVNVWYMVPITFGLSNPAAQPGQKTPPPPPPPPLPGYDEPPVFKRGEASLFKFINSKLVYPKAAKEKSISGKVYVRFSIGTDGSIGDVVLAKGVSPELDAEAIRVIKLLPAWKPAKLDGKPVQVRYSIPVTFSLK